MESVSVVGLGKLGQCFAACYAKRGFRTIGVDVNAQVIESLNAGRATLVEPGLQDIIEECAGKTFFATTEHAKAIAETDVTFILVATPTDHQGNFSNEYVESALVALAQSLRASEKKHHLFVVSSTLMPTAIEQRIIPLIEEHSGRRLNDGFSVCYNPDFVALGNVVHGFLNPDFVLIGESSPEAGARVVELYERFLENKAPVFRMNIVSAEIAKVSLNTYITMKISFANTLANICEKVPGADVDSITRAIGTDKRISPYYLKGGLAYGGTCFPRDTGAFISFSKKVDNPPLLIEAVERVNQLQDENLASIVLRETHALRESKKKTNIRVGILGAAFKPGTPVIVASPAIALIDRLLHEGVEVLVYDHLATENVKQRYGERVKIASSIRECFNDSSVVVVAGADKEFQNMNESVIAHNPTTVVDCWRLNQKLSEHRGVRYLALGKPYAHSAD
ncbi:MAG: nucleotide sugar dehydrogenase [Ignavibacteriae bacterium]|nr:nucleotide sugar dehydrogenase [Ignavibacteriota bacterium]